MDVIVPPQPVEAMAAAPVSERAQARRETLRVLFRRPAFVIGNIVIIGWIITAVLGERIRRTIPSTTSLPATCRRAPSIGWVPTGSVVTCSPG